VSSTERMPVIYTAQSKVYFYCRDAVCEFVFANNAVPVNPFRVFEYFLNDRVDRNLVRQGNNNLIQIVDELWAFGDTIADGVLFEILFAKKIGKPVRFFTIDNRASSIREIKVKNLRFEREVYRTTEFKRKEQILAAILGYPPDQPPPKQVPLFDGEEVE
jgi:hypothetical protein